MTEEENGEQLYRPYVSLDLETTGLDVINDQVLSVGMVIDQGFKNVDPEEMTKLHLAIIPKSGKLSGGLTALSMNKELIGHINEAYDEMIGSIEPGQEPLEEWECDSYPYNVFALPDVACSRIMDMLTAANAHAAQYDREHGLKRELVQVAAKNGEKLDLPMLENFFSAHCFEKPNLRKEFISHRSIDIGSAYITKYGRNVSLNTINKDIGNTEVSHNALEDAIDNVIAYRSLFL